jgi:hypothetical protein
MGLETLFAAGFAAFQAFAGSAIGGFLVKSAIGVGLSLGLSAFSQKKAKQAGQSAPTGVQLEMATGADTPRSVVFNEAATAGHLVWLKETGANNDTLHMNIVYSDGWCAPPRGVIVDGVEKALIEQPVTGTEHARYHVADFGTDIIVRWHDGRPGQAADSDMVAVSGGDITVNDVGDGLAYFSVSIAIKEDGITSAPEFLWLGGGYRCYDLRKDETVGGSGAHRLDDPTTWEPSGNPFVQFYNYAVGISAGSDSKALGGFADVDGLIGTTFMVAGNVADEGVTTEGVTEPRYACSAILAADGEDHRGKVAGLLQAGAGWAVERGGQLGVLAGAAQTPVVTFTDDDLILDEEVEWSRDKERDERFNEVRGLFVSPAALYRKDDYPVVKNAAALTMDGERRVSTLDLGTVQSPTQAQRIADIRLEESRLGRASVPLPEAFLALEVGDWVRWSSARYGDFSYRIERAQDDDNGVIRLPLQRMSNTVYGGPSFGTYTPPPTPSLPPLAPSTVSGFELQADVIEGEGGGIPALIATWTPPNDPRVDAVIVQYRQIGSLAWQSQSQLSPEEGRLPITGLAPGADYEVRLSITTTPSRNVTWTVPKSIKTANPPVVIGDESVSLTSLNLGVQDILANVNRNLAALQQIVAASATSGSLEALQRYTEDGEIKALVSRTGEVARAQVVQETIARTSAIEALAAQSLLVQAELDGSTATSLMALQSAVSGDGLTTSFGVLLRGDTGDAFKEAGMTFELVSDGGDPATFESEIRVKADKFKFDNGHQLVAITEDGTFLKDLFVERIRSSPALTDRGFDLNGLTGEFTMWATPS